MSTTSVNPGWHDAIASDGRRVYKLTSGPYYGYPAASMSVGNTGTYVALSRGFAPGDVLTITVQSEDDARELCGLHASLLAKLAAR